MQRAKCRRRSELLRQQVPQPDAQRPSDRLDPIKRRVPGTALDFSEKLVADTGFFGELLLGQFAGPAQITNPKAEASSEVTHPREYRDRDNSVKPSKHVFVNNTYMW